MNMILTAATAGSLTHLLIGFLVIIVVLAIIAGLIYAIERWIIGSPLPGPVKLVIGLVLIVLVILWAIQNLGGG
jgi:hypothetical protein